ncbi:MAG: glycosyltransferase family 4 protein [Kiritimatiellae bacterium]|nr:glycosyltransferase family 4 protein [Kiritimatiellia bacterium]
MSAERKDEQRVVFIGPTYPFKGGIAQYCTLFFRHLRQRRNVEMHTFRKLYPAWLFPGNSTPDPSTQALREDGVVRSLAFLDPFTFFRLGTRLRRRGARCVIAAWWTFAWAPHLRLLLAGLRGAVPTVFWCHNVFDHGRSRLKRAAVRGLLRRVDRFVVHSQAECRHLAGVVQGADIRVGFLPLLRAFETPGAAAGPAAEEARATGGTGPKRVLFFGFVRPYKGLDDLLAAWPRVVAGERAQLHIAGEFWGRSKEATLARIRELGIESSVRIDDTYTPNEAIPALFRSADLVALPYREATGSGVANLAIEFERPLVVTDVGSLPETVVPGRTGWIARARDPEDLAACVLQALRAGPQRDALRALHRERAGSWETLLDLFDGVMDAWR